MKKVTLLMMVLISVSAFAAPFVVPFGKDLHYTLRPLENGAIRVTCGGYDEPEESLKLYGR